MRKTAGFTLIELMVAVAILGILMALAAGSWGAIGARGSVANAASDFHSALLNARQRAAERGGDVWVIVYPYIDRNGNEDASKNSGAYFVVEDLDMTFNSYFTSTFSPPTTIRPGPPNGLLEAVYLEEYPRHNARFLQNTVAGAYKAPFATLTGAGCGFCDGTPKRGAVVFSGDGTARFHKSDGTTAAARSVSLAVSSVNIPIEQFFFAVTGPTGFVGQYVR